MGGASRVSVFGYLGLRLRQTDLNISPTLPPQIPYLTYRTIYWQGHAISASANQTHTTLTRLNRTTPGYNPLYSYPPSTHISNTTNTTTTIPIPVTLSFFPQIYNLTFSAPLIIPNRRPDLNLTVPNNLAQCRPIVTSTASYLPGRFPLSAIDGAVSTAWQPVSNASASITVDLGSDAAGVAVVGFAFDWAQAPAERWSVSFSNFSSSDESRVVASGNVTISAPYNALNAAALVQYQSNTTEVELPQEVWGGRYATLTIEGSWAGDGSGASVAEWAVIAGGGGDSGEVGGSDGGSGGSGGMKKRKVEMRRYFKSD